MPVVCQHTTYLIGHALGFMASEERFPCEVCGETFDSQEALQEHGEEAHQDHDPDEHADQP